MGDHDDLLRRFQPALRYDSMEQFFCDSAAEWTDNPGHELRRADAGGRPGALIAREGGGDGIPALTLQFLAPGHYPDGTEVRDDDRIGDPRTDYRAQYVALREQRPDLRDRMYGRAVQSRGRLWLQYWFFYFYNDYNLAAGKGRHEGDWEMVQLRIHDDAPDVAVYAQHRRAEQRMWPQVERLPGRPDTPVVYVARGSHASYFEAGYHETEAWYDLADGRRPAPEIALEIVTDDEPSWIAWPGVWGDTRPRMAGGLDQPSPTAPCRHAAWRNPDSLLDNAWEPTRKAPVDPPAVSVSRELGHMRVDFDFARQGGPPPATLQVTVNSRDEPDTPPRAYTFDVEDTQRGTLMTRVELDPAKHYDIYVSTTAGDPPLPSASTLTELDPQRPIPGRPLVERAALGFGRVIAWMLGHLPR
jgi:hypothetical protein